MARLYVCEHSLELLIRALETYRPAEEDVERYHMLLDYLEKFAEEEALLSERSPEDIPF